MTETEKMAERLFKAAIGPDPFPYSPYGKRPQLADLWPSDQERYLKMAEAALARNEETKKLPVDVWADRLARDLSKFTD